MSLKEARAGMKNKVVSVICTTFTIKEFTERPANLFTIFFCRHHSTSYIKRNPHPTFVVRQIKLFLIHLGTVQRTEWIRIQKNENKKW